MKACKVKTSDVKRCVEHALNNTKNGASILFVHDDGVYIMSAGTPRDMVGNKNYVAYCEGCNPNKDDDFYDHSRYLVGGDDFTEKLRVTKATLKRCEEYEELQIEITETKMQVIFFRPKCVFLAKNT